MSPVQGALPGLVAILKRFVPFPGPPSTGASTVRRAADAITNLAHENVSIKSRVRTEGGIPPLVALLGSYDAKVRSSLEALCGRCSRCPGGSPRQATHALVGLHTSRRGRSTAEGHQACKGAPWCAQRGLSSLLFKGRGTESLEGSSSEQCGSMRRCSEQQRARCARWRSRTRTTRTR